MNSNTISGTPLTNQIIKLDTPLSILLLDSLQRAKINASIIPKKNDTKVSEHVHCKPAFSAA